MEEVVKRHILESFREKYHRAGKLAKGELLEEVHSFCLTYQGVTL
ncbi:MAG: hypothetical protein RIS36_36 [Pseudomonadota bacterium]|jgi:hypothetical protein